MTRSEKNIFPSFVHKRILHEVHHIVASIFFLLGGGFIYLR
uniref:Uncharacterized protein n=1 Tax=Rhizophora mucronata TaxID=61149 RepID=A0A2P2IZF2_RHIMU